MLNPAFRRPEDLEQLLGLNVLAAIPDFAFEYAQSTKQRGFGASKVAVPSDVHNVSRQAKSGANPGRPEWWRWRVPDKRTNRIPPGLTLVAKSQPTSVVAEQYRVAASQLSLMEAGRSTTVVLATSAVKGEGKSTTMVNLGYTLARDLGKRTLLIDADFKCPAVHWYLEVPPEPGLADVLAKGIPLERCLSRLGEIPFWVLPVGSLGKWPNSLAKVHEFASILADLRARFEYILIDAPPILPLADVNVLGGLADVLRVVVRAGSTPQDIVRRALNTLGLATQPPVILNGVEARSMPYYMHYDYQAQSAEEQRV